MTPDGVFDEPRGEVNGPRGDSNVRAAKSVAAGLAQTPGWKCNVIDEFDANGNVIRVEIEDPLISQP